MLWIFILHPKSIVLQLHVLNFDWVKMFWLLTSGDKLLILISMCLSFPISKVTMTCIPHSIGLRIKLVNVCENISRVAHYGKSWPNISYYHLKRKIKVKKLYKDFSLFFFFLYLFSHLPTYVLVLFLEAKRKRKIWVYCLFFFYSQVIEWYRIYFLILT